MNATNKVNFIKDWIKDYVDKMPIKAVVRTGIVSGHFRGVVATLLTVVALLLNIFTACCVGLTRHSTLISKQSHARGVG